MSELETKKDESKKNAKCINHILNKILLESLYNSDVIKELIKNKLNYPQISKMKLILSQFNQS